MKQTTQRGIAFLTKQHLDNYHSKEGKYAYTSHGSAKLIKAHLSQEEQYYTEVVFEDYHKNKNYGGYYSPSELEYLVYNTV